MKLLKVLKILCLSIIASSLYCCKPEEIILHGEISGFVTDTTTSQPIQSVPVKLNPVNDTTSTSSDGKFLFKSLVPGDYKIEVSKPPFSKSIRNVAVNSANISVVDFALRKISYPEISPRHLDFGFDSISKSFTIKNTGTGKLNYSLLPSQDWITVNPNIGEATTETDTFKVTINRTGLSEKKHVESIEVVSHVGPDLVRDTIYVLLNGVMDQDKNYYGIVTIGTQTWMAENLNTGIAIPISQVSTNNRHIEKWCYDCKTYGGLYTWFEAMQYNPPDSEMVDRGITQGICPVGWHIPKGKDWSTLFDYVGGNVGEGGIKLRETGSLHWNSPNTGATNETGFTALPGGQANRGDDWCSTDPSANRFVDQGYFAGFWGTQLNVFASCSWWSSKIDGFSIRGDGTIGGGTYTSFWGASVRCIKDPPKK
jgi:uncharacterized protein (TIGR02145 family)